MYLTPAEGLDGSIDDISTIVAHFQDGGHRQTRARVAVILDDDIRMSRLDGLRQRTEHGRLSNAGHILQTDFLCSRSNHLVGYPRVILHCMDRRGCDT